MKFFLFSFLFVLSCGLKLGCTQNIQKEGFTCTTDEECQSFILESKCIQSSCQCPEDRVLSSDGSSCLERIKEYGSPCEENIQCSARLSSGGICHEGACVCKPGYHYLKGSCWKSTGLHGKCYRDEQCFATYESVGLKCDESECKCRLNYRERLNSGCRRERKTGEACNLESDCIDGSKCVYMTCSDSATVGRSRSVYFNATTAGKEETQGLNCPLGMFEYNNQCVRELGMECTADLDCNHIKYAMCLDGNVCACQPVKFVASEDNRECLRVTRGMVEEIRSSSCKKDPQCGVFGEDSFCNNKRCECKRGTYFDKENKFCWKIRSLGTSCSDDKDCHPSETHAECVEKDSEKLCRCKKGYHAQGSNCVPDALEVGDPCEKDSECLFPNSFCNSSKTCTCKKHYFPNKGKCEPGVGTLCVTNDDCAHLNHTECKIDNLPLKQCLCLENHTNSDDYKYCLPVAYFKKSCQESFQCKYQLGELGECKQNICQCQEGSHYYSGKCYKSVFLGQQCSKRPDCYPGNDTNSILCLKGRCSCNYDYHELTGAGVCVRTNSAATVKFHWMALFMLFLRLK